MILYSNRECVRNGRIFFFLISDRLEFKEAWKTKRKEQSPAHTGKLLFCYIFNQNIKNPFNTYLLGHVLYLTLEFIGPDWTYESVILIDCRTDICLFVLFKCGGIHSSRRAWCLINFFTMFSGRAESA